jgi:hypothetical protein
MALAPLTHHDILGLAEPFSRGGRQLDLAASARAQRHLAFRPVTHPGNGQQQPLLTETLLLEALDSGNFRLTRTLTDPSGLQAQLRAVGPQQGKLLADIDAVPPHTQFRFLPESVAAAACAVAISLRLEPGGGPPASRSVVTQGRVQLAGLALTMEVSAVRGIAAEVRLEGALVVCNELPQDLLAVQGWSWTRLARDSQGWHSRVRLRGKEALRSERALARLDEVATHLACTLAEPPARYHPRHRRARWGVVLRRGIPMLTLVLLAVGLWGLSRWASGLSEKTGAWVLLLHVPTAMLAIGFSLQEMAQFEIPPLPRPLTALAWRTQL